VEIDQASEFFSNHKNTVKDIFESGVCNYCGACILVCPKDAISYKEMEISVNESCIYCRKCIQFCSQNQEFSYISENSKFRDNSKIKLIQPRLSEVPFGQIENIYISKSLKKNVLRESMVGGTTLSLLLYALRSSIIDAALITDFGSDGPFPSGKLITSENELLSSGGSKYLPTLSLSKLTEVVEKKNIQSLAITTLPCQAYAIKKLASNPETADLTSKIKLVLTLLCGSGLPSKKDLELYFKKKGVEENITELEAYKKNIKRFWRLNPQDQQRYIYKTKSGKKYDFSARRILKTKSRENCRLLCPDYTGYFSDISIGGAGLSSNVTITRSEQGEQIFQAALKEGFIETRKFSPLNNILINLMGKRKREGNRLAYEELI